VKQIKFERSVAALVKKYGVALAPLDYIEQRITLQIGGESYS
jgi:hypothetical protein